MTVGPDFLVLRSLLPRARPQYGEAVLTSVPDKPNVLLLTHGDEVINSVRYAHRVLRIRPRLTVLDMNYAQFEWFTERARLQPDYANLTFPGKSYGASKDAYLISELLHANYAKFSIFVAGGFVPRDPSWEMDFRLVPLGMVSQVLRRGATIKLDKWAAKTASMLPHLTFARAPDEGSWEQTVARNHYLSAYHGRPYCVLQLAYEEPGAPEARDRFLLAARLYEETKDVMLNASMVLPDFYFRNMGVAYSQLMGLEPTEEGRAGAKQKATIAFLRYLRFDTVSDDDRKTVEQGILSLIPPPPGYESAQQAAQQQAAQQQAAQQHAAQRAAQQQAEQRAAQQQAQQQAQRQAQQQAQQRALRQESREAGAASSRATQKTDAGAGDGAGQGTVREHTRTRKKKSKKKGAEGAAAGQYV